VIRPGASRLGLALAFGLTLFARGAEPEGTVIAIGGGRLPDAVVDRFLDLADARKGGLVLVCPAASEEVEGPELERFRSRGATTLEVLDFRKRPDADEAARVATIARARGVFFTGGDQRRLLDVLDGSKALAALRRAHERGAVIAGTSAGCAVLGELAIAGDGEPTSVAAGATPVRAGFGLVRGVVFDQHFLARRRHNRLVSVLRAAPTLLGIGVDEATAVVSRGSAPLEVIGNGVASVYSSTGPSAFALTLVAPGERFARAP
jgi:cyanophycinase